MSTRTSRVMNPRSIPYLKAKPAPMRTASAPARANQAPASLASSRGASVAPAGCSVADVHAWAGWTAKAEYLYSQFPGAAVSFPQGGQVPLSASEQLQRYALLRDSPG